MLCSISDWYISHTSLERSELSREVEDGLKEGFKDGGESSLMEQRTEINKGHSCETMEPNCNELKN